MTPTLVYVPMNFVANWFFANWRIHHVMYLTAILELVGGWIRVLSFLNDSFWLLELGTFIFCLVGPFIMNSISLIANMWFSEDERARSTALSGMMIPVGTIMGFVITGVISHGMDPEDS